MGLRALQAAAILSLLLTAWSAPAITVSWDPNTEPDLAGYVMERNGAEAGRVEAGAPPVGGRIVWQDLNIPCGASDAWTVRAHDTSANYSGPSLPAYCGRAWWPAYRPRPATPPVRQPWRERYSPRPAQPPARQPWWPGYRKGD